MIICGIDPGAKGGLCFMESLTKEILYVCPMPMLEKELDYTKVSDLFWEYVPDKIIIEHVHAMPNQGVVSMFNFGRMYGGLKGIAHVYCVNNVVTARPKEWQKALFGLVKWDKSVGINFVKDRFPDTKIILPRCRKEHDGITDAICIAYYEATK